MTSRENGKAKAAFSALVGQNYERAQTQLCLASVADGAPNIQRVQITDYVAEEFRAIIQGKLDKLAKAYKGSDVVLQQYAPQTHLDAHEIEWLELTDHVAIGNQIVGLSDPVALEVFAAAEKFVDELRFYALIVTPAHGKPAVCFRSYSPKKELNRSALLAIVARRGTYDRLRDRVFLFDSRIDCIASQGYLFLLNKSNFQNIFRFYEELTKSAEQTLGIIKASIPI